MLTAIYVIGAIVTIAGLTFIGRVVPHFGGLVEMLPIGLRWPVALGMADIPEFWGRRWPK